jgi:Fe2+ transport system protein B
MEVASSGNDWYRISGGTASISLAPYVQEVLQWAQLKMYEDRQLNELCIKHPELQSAKDQYENVALLAKKNEEERRKFEEQMRVQEGLLKATVAEREKAVAKADDYKEKLDSWTVLTA